MKRSRFGMTLMELLVSIAVLSVVSTIGLSALYKVTDSFKTATIRLDLTRKAENTFSFMRNDFNQVLSFKLSGVPVYGESRWENTERFNQVTPLENDLVVLPLESRNPKTGWVERNSAQYSILREPQKPPCLVRTLGPLGEKTPKGAVQMLAENVLSMRVEYLDAAGEWRPDWNQPGLPDAVRVSMTMCDPARPYEQIARKAVFPIHVK